MAKRGYRTPEREARSRIAEAARKNATDLDLSYLGLRMLPPEIGELTSLKRLSLQENQLVILPAEIGKLTNLTVLHVHDNQLSELPISIGKQTNLIELGIVGNHLSELPAEIGQLAHLKTLWLDGNQLADLPSEIGKLTNLIGLSLARNRLASLPAKIGKLTNLTTLSLDRNRLETLPAELGELTSLKLLSLVGNQLKALPAEIGKLISLTRLALHGNRLSMLPIEIGKLTNLTTLSLERNRLVELPSALFDLTNLRKLSLNNNRLSILPPNIGRLTSLTKLLLDGNKFAELPTEIGKLSNLTTLYLHGNRLTQLPAPMGKLTNLTTLPLNDNQLSALPVEIGQLANLTELSLDGNPLPDSLVELARNDVSAALAFIRDQGTEGGSPLYEAKLVLVGEGDVGKTCLLRALQGKRFKHQQTTKGMEVAREPLPLPHPDIDATIMLNAWDFGGQKEYQVTQQFFFSPRSLYLVVWDPRSGHEKCDVEGWINRIRLRVGDDATVLVVATHCHEGDAPPAVNIDKHELRREYGDVIAGFFEIDSKDDFGIDDLKQEIANHASRLRGMGDTLPQTWKKARADILDLGKKKTPWISRERFTEICRDASLQDDAIEGLLILLHELGQIVYFGSKANGEAPTLSGHDEERLGDIVILQPEWLAKAVCFVLEDAETRKAAGVLNYSRLAKIWHDDRKTSEKYDAKLYPYFLALMEKYDTCYRLKEDNTSLVPQLIQRGRPKDLLWYPEDELSEIPQHTLVCEMDEVPPGLVPLMIVRTHRFSKKDTHWQLGAFLDHERHGEAHMALVDRELRFTVRGDYPPHFMTLLADSFEVLVEKAWPGLRNRYRLSAPCPHRDEQGKPCPGRFPLEILRTIRMQQSTDPQQTKVPCMRCAKWFEIDKLLDGLSAPGVSPEERLMIVQAQTQQTNDKLQELSSYASEMFRLVLRSINNETAAAPGMFTLLPDDGLWSKIAGKRKFQLTLWCEHPDCPHPLCKIGSGGVGEYSFERSADWLVKIAPYVTWTARVLKVALPIASGAIQVGLDEFGIKDLKPKLDLMEKCAQALPGGELETFEGDIQPTGIFSRPDGAALREFHDLLKAEVKGRSWGGLRRTLTKTGDYLWLCPKHFDEFEPALPKIS